jgi:hypothetical protein
MVTASIHWALSLHQAFYQLHIWVISINLHNNPVGLWNYNFQMTK